MDDDQRLSQLEDKLNELTEIAEENNEILRYLRRNSRWSFWGRLLIWIIVLVLPFIVLGPFLKAIIPDISTAGGHSLFGLPSETQVKALLDEYRNGSSTGQE